MEYTKKRKANSVKIIILVVFLIMIAIFAVTQGSVKIPVSQVVKIIIHSKDADQIKPSYIFIVNQVRLPRIILSILVGGVLSIIGTVFQAVFKNPMADPYVMGVSSGAAFGATMGIIFGFGISIAGLGMVSIMAFVGAFSTMLLVYQLSKVGGRVSTTGILLAGIVVNAILSSVISFVMLLNHNDIDKIVTWTMGSFNASSWDHVKLFLIPMFVGVAYMLSLSRELNTLAISENDAKNIGVNVELIKKGTLVVASMLAALSVSVSGIIGFVGLIVPHLFRMIFGSDHRILLPVSFIGGGLFMVICDTMARSLLGNMEIPVGIITSIIGGPFFLMLLQRHKRKFI
ncbi:iron ABC transporter permease [Fusibacter bizertensis]|uniref:Iron ABC transporter permease n=1 Tax=Fusibacter bizertensis TaxID=1488331 RepID=A0ABT6NFH4_9FIRM|nr:iron ABC transporter permease [Fusibacter bizertensis]MDH8679151.1 iron ABC transporter permease [Fusibacter bizertensis]